MKQKVGIIILCAVMAFVAVSCSALWTVENKADITFSLSKEAITTMILDSNVRNIDSSNGAVLATISLYREDETRIAFQNIILEDGADATVTFERLKVVGDNVYAKIEATYNGVKHEGISEIKRMVFGENDLHISGMNPVKNIFTLRFDANGGTVEPTSKTVTDGMAIGELPTPSKEATNFLMWQIDGEPISRSTLYSYEEDKTAIAIWGNVATYIVNFNTNGGSFIDSIGVAHGLTIEKPADSTKGGYTFAGWYTDSSFNTLWDFAIDTVTSAITLHAKWTANTYTLTFDEDGGTLATGSPNSKVVTFGQAIGELPTVEKAGYTFSDWAINNSKIDESTVWTFAEDKIAIALWTESGDTPYTVNHYKQDVTGDDYTLVTEDTVSATGKTGASITPATNAYTGFISPSVQSTTIAANGSTLIEYYYNRTLHTVTYVVDETKATYTGSLVTNNIRYGATTPEVTITAKDGYIFSSWNPVVASHVTGDATYTAQLKVKTFTVTYKLDSGSGTVPTQPALAERETFIVADGNGLTNGSLIFDGWNDGTSDYWPESIYTMGSEDVTLTAQWRTTTRVIAALSENDTILTITPTTNGTGDSLKATIEAVNDNKRGTITTITIVEPAGGAKIIPETDLSFLFGDWTYNYDKLTSINGLEHIDTSQVTDMSYMFYDCNSLTTLNLNNFDTSKVINMSSMFASCSALESLTLPNNFNASLVTNMSSMFNKCSALTTLELSESFDTSQVTNMSAMFNSCSDLESLTLPQSFDTSKVINMSSMFASCSALESLTLPNNFNASLVTNMSAMFYDCSTLGSLTLPNNFNTSKVTNMGQMFHGCTALTTLDLSGFNTSLVTSSSDMFNSVTLDSVTVGANLTKDVSILIKPKSGGNYVNPGVWESDTYSGANIKVNEEKAVAGTYTARRLIDTVYLNGADVNGGDDGNSGADANNAVKTFEMALSLLSEGGTIWITDTVTVASGTPTWQKPVDWTTGELTVKRYDNATAPDKTGTSFPGNLISVTGSTSTLTLQNITIDGMGGTVTATGSLINVSSGGNLTLTTGAVLQNNNFSSSSVSATGGAINFAGTTLTMSGGEIKGNSAGNGGGVYVAGATFDMSGGTISGNSADSGSGVYIGAENSTMLKLSKNAFVENNTSDNIFYTNTTASSPVKITGKLESVIYLNPENTSDGFVVAESYDSYSITGPDMSYLNVYDNSGNSKSLVLDEGKVLIKPEALPNTTKEYYVSETGKSWGNGSEDFPFDNVQVAVDAIKTGNDGTSEYTINIIGTITKEGEEKTEGMVEIIENSKNLNITLNGNNTPSGVIDASGLESRVLYISGTNNNISVTLSGSLKITGGNTYKDGGGIFIADGTLLLDSTGVVITGNDANAGGGIAIGVNGNVEMRRGEITGNTASGNGGGVWIHTTGATLKLNKAPYNTAPKITNNTKLSDGSDNNVYFVPSLTQSPVKISAYLGSSRTAAQDIGLSPSFVDKNVIMVQGDGFIPRTVDVAMFKLDTAAGTLVSHSDNIYMNSSIGAKGLTNQSSEGVVFHFDGSKYYEVSNVLIAADGENWFSYDEAITAASNYKGGGKEDWILPDRDMLERVYFYGIVSGFIGEIEKGFWSSTEYSDTQAYTIGLDTGVAVIGPKEGSEYVVAIRSFTP